MALPKMQQDVELELSVRKVTREERAAHLARTKPAPEPSDQGVGSPGSTGGRERVSADPDASGTRETVDFVEDECEPRAALPLAQAAVDRAAGEAAHDAAAAEAAEYLGIAANGDRRSWGSWEEERVRRARLRRDFVAAKRCCICVVS
ncbi:hypothetical protein B0A49_07821 [Cryomyces minteri]|uniref:Uncharacterized protein n=1 Tax=Cryomyces minteri TaxID=331657 RepID=A0A4U0X204_9PEZI|nr:hypothetical protein B0A49_07821 [Cryomyces minteri]